MNKKWIDASHESAEIYKSNLSGLDEKIYLIRILDIAGMFETGWMIFNHLSNMYGYPK